MNRIQVCYEYHESFSNIVLSVSAEGYTEKERTIEIEMKQDGQEGGYIV